MSLFMLYLFFEIIPKREIDEPIVEITLHIA